MKNIYIYAQYFYSFTYLGTAMLLQSENYFKDFEHLHTNKYFFVYNDTILKQIEKDDLLLLNYTNTSPILNKNRVSIDFTKQFLQRYAFSFFKHRLYNLEYPACNQFRQILSTIKDPSMREYILRLTVEWFMNELQRRYIRSGSLDLGTDPLFLHINECTPMDVFIKHLIAIAGTLDSVVEYASMKPVANYATCFSMSQ